MSRYEFNVLDLRTADDGVSVTGIFSVSPPIHVGEGLSKAIIDKRHHADVLLDHVITTETETIFRCETGPVRTEYENRDAIKGMALRIINMANDPENAARKHY